MSAAEKIRANTLAQNAEKGGQSSRARARGMMVLKKAADLLDLLGDKAASRAVRVLEEGMEAEKTFWDRETEAWITQADFKERREAAMGFLAYRFGKPIERQISAHGNFEELSAMMERMNQSPAAREMLEDEGISPGKLVTKGTLGQESASTTGDSPSVEPEPGAQKS